MLSGMRSEFNRYMPAIHCEVWVLMLILSATFYGIAYIHWQLKVEFHQHLHSTLSVLDAFRCYAVSQVFPPQLFCALFYLSKSALKWV